MDYSSGTIEQQMNTSKKKGSKTLLWGCLGALGIAIVLCIAGGTYTLLKFGGEPEGLSAEYSMPEMVNQGETFELVISMTNTGSSSFEITEIDLDEALDDSILDGAIVLSTTPPLEKDYSLSGIKTFKYYRTIQPGETQTVTFAIQAVTPGEYGGSIGIYVGDQSKRFDYVGIVITE